jgi:hypothetical protein
MTARQFYEAYLKEIAVDKKTLDDARKRRDEIATKAKKAVAAAIGAPVKFIPAGAMAAGTQIAPLSDVDTVLEVPYRLPNWITNPRQALLDVKRWVEPVINAEFELSTHAIKLTFPDEDFTADIVVGATRTGGGIHIPHCPKDEPHHWIDTHPAAHAQMVRDRNKAIGYEFAREIRIIKALNRQMGFRTADERKPLSSFHVTALALTLLHDPISHDTTTPLFLSAAARAVTKPLRNPAGVGPDIEARNPSEAAALLADAAAVTDRALRMHDAEDTLRELFGDPAKTLALVSGAPASVNSNGRLAVGLGAAAGVRSVPPVRSHGDGGRF